MAGMRSSEQNQQKILDFIRSEIETKGYPPSVREICHAVNLSSTSTVHMHLRTLENRGLIRRDASKPRALEVLERWKLPVKVSRAMERRTGCPATSRLAEKSKYWER